MAWQMADTVDLEIAAWSPSASARVASTSRTDRPRTNEAITRDSRALVLVTWLPNSREANASVVPRSFGRDSTTGTGVPSRRGAGVTIPPQELGDLRLQGRLHQQLRPEPGHLLQDLRQRTVLGEQLVDVATDTVGRGYSVC